METDCLSLRERAIEEFEKHLKSGGIWQIEGNYNGESRVLKLDSNSKTMRNYYCVEDRGCAPIDLVVLFNDKVVSGLQFISYDNDPINRCRSHEVFYISPDLITKNYKKYDNIRLVNGHLEPGKIIDGVEQDWAKCHYNFRSRECPHPYYHNARCEDHYNRGKPKFFEDPGHNPENGACIPWNGPAYKQLCGRYGEPPCSFKSVWSVASKKHEENGEMSLNERPELFLQDISYLDPELIKKLQRKFAESIYDELPLKLKLQFLNDINAGKVPKKHKQE